MPTCEVAKQKVNICDSEYWMDTKSWLVPDEVIERLLDFNEQMNRERYKIWMPNIQENIGMLAEDKYLENIYGTWEGERILVCGAGKTLKDNIDHVKKAQGAGFKVVCVDRALITLAHHKIVPDYVITVDASDAVNAFLDPLGKDHKVAICLHQSPKVVRRAARRAGKHYFFLPISPFSRLGIKQFNTFPRDLFKLRSAASVGFFAADFALWMANTKPEYIALIGNELGWFYKNEVDAIYWHSKQFPILVREHKDTRRIFFTIEPFVTTASAFKHFQTLHPETKFVDCSMGLIDIFDQVPLKTLVEEANHGKYGE